MKYEYKIQKFTTDELTLDSTIATLNLLGEDGWEAVGMDNHHAYNSGNLHGTAILLKRHKL